MTEFLCAIGLLTLAAVVLIAIHITIEELTDEIKALKKRECNDGKNK